MKARGTTFRVKRDDAPWRLTPWGVHWNVYPEGRVGRPKQKSKWYVTEAEAREFVARAEALLAVTPAAPVARMHRAAGTVAALSEKWLDEVKAEKAGATWKNYAYVMGDYLAPEPTYPAGHRKAGQPHPRYPGLGNVIVTPDTLHEQLIYEYLVSLHGAGVSLSMRHRVHAVMSAFCAFAKTAGKLRGVANPCLDMSRRLKRKGEEEQLPVPNPFTRAERDAILDHVQACEEEWYGYFLFLFHTGVRVGEAAGLRWDTVDWDRRRVKIEWNFSPADGADKDPKTHEKRWIDLTTDVLAWLQTWQAVQRAAAFRHGKPVPLQVFTTTTRLARMRQDGNMPVVFARVMAALGIEGHTPHDTRDTFATLHLSMNWDRKLDWVSKQLGHATPTTTSKFYYAYRPTAMAASFADEIR